MGGKIRSFSHLKWATAHTKILRSLNLHFFLSSLLVLWGGVPTEAIVTSCLKGGWASPHFGSAVCTAIHLVMPLPFSSRQSSLTAKRTSVSSAVAAPPLGCPKAVIADAIFFPVVPLDKTGHNTSQLGLEDILRSVTQSHIKISVNSETDILLMFSIEVTTLAYNII